MLLVAPIKKTKQVPVTGQHLELFGIDKLNLARSEISAVTHVDYSARIQTVHKNTNPRFYALIDEFEKHTGCPVLINTSFNVRGEPIVNSPEDAYRCFMRTEMDYLVIENILLAKSDQHPHEQGGEWKKEFELD
jgi:carbamoyltransferase